MDATEFLEKLIADFRLGTYDLRGIMFQVEAVSSWRTLRRGPRVRIVLDLYETAYLPAQHEEVPRWDESTIDAPPL